MSINVKVEGRWQTKETCPDTGKVMHPSRDACSDQIRFLSGGNVRRRDGQGKTRRSAVAYRCTFCNAWHVGTQGRR